MITLKYINQHLHSNIRFSCNVLSNAKHFLSLLLYLSSRKDMPWLVNMIKKLLLRCCFRRNSYNCKLLKTCAFIYFCYKAKAFVTAPYSSETLKALRKLRQVPEIYGIFRISLINNFIILIKVFSNTHSIAGSCLKYNITITQLQSKNTGTNNMGFNNNCIRASFSVQKKSIKTETSSSTSQIIFLRVLILLFSLSSFNYISTTSFHKNVKYGVNPIKTKYGLLRGIVVRSSPLVEAYLGIPYASPPIGSLRFMPPITPSSWKNIRNADRFSPVCPQTVPNPPNGPEALLQVPRARLLQLRRIMPLLGNQSEDCLYLNIYMPKRSSSAKSNKKVHYETDDNTTAKNDQLPKIEEKLSSILFIHGESYEWNSGNPYDGAELAAQGNVIVVTINFRLGILGFLKTGGKESAQGNFGLMDLVAGLHWLKENLPAFGGDSNKITLMGHGTGAALANILLVSPVSSDLIQRAALISGSALSPWAIQKSPLFVKRRVAEQTGCHGDLLYDDLAPCLRTKKLSELLAVKIDQPRFLSGFAPFVDGTVIAPNRDIIRSLKLPLGSAIVSPSGIEFANFPKQNLIFGLTSVESYLDLSAQDLEFGLNETRRDRILRTYVRNVFHYHLNEIFAVLKNEYTDWEKAIRNPFSSRDATLSFLSDGHTASHLIKIGYMHSLRGGKSYFLHFKHKTDEEEYELRSGSVRGEDVPFWLGLPISPIFPKNYSSQEQRLSLVMVKYLTNFVKTGNPNHSTNSLNKDSETNNDFDHDIRDIHNKIWSNTNNTINDNNLESNTFAQTTKKSLIVRSKLTFKLPRKKRSNAKLNNSKLKSNAKKESFGRNKKTYTYVHRKHTHFDGMLKDDIDKGLPNLDDDVPYWETYDSINQLYLEIENKPEVQSHYRGHKLSMWLNLIPQLHKHSNMEEASMKHHQFVEENAQFYDGIVRDDFQTKHLDDDDDQTFYINMEKLKGPSAVIEINRNKFLPDEINTDCGPNTTKSPAVVPPIQQNNNSNTSETFPSVLENMNVLRRLSGKQLESYSTALVATVAVGCFLLVLNILIFAGIYHQREKRTKDSKEKEKLEENELLMNITSTQYSLTTNSHDTTLDKVAFGEYKCFDGNSSQIAEKEPPENLEENTNQGSSWPCAANAIKCSNDSLSAFTTNDNSPFMPAREECSPAIAFPIQTHEMSYQDVDDFIKEEGVIDKSIPQPPPPPKSLHPNQGGILRISGTNQLSSSSKKRVHIREISV